jgi:hypothetical protein
MVNIFVNLVDNIIDEGIVKSVYIPFLVSIMGIAFPLFYEMVSKSSDKFSPSIMDEFKAEIRYRNFVYVLKLCLIFLFLWIIKLPSFFSGILIENSAAILLFMFCSLLVFLFFPFLTLVMKYSNEKKLTLHLINKLNSKKVVKNRDNIVRILQIIFLYNIDKLDDKINDNIWRFLFDDFLERKEEIRMMNKKLLKNLTEKEETGLTNNNVRNAYRLPQYIYDFINEISEKICFDNTKNKYGKYMDATLGSSWLLYSFTSSKIPDYSYYCIWINLILALESGRDELISLYWRNAHYIMQKIKYHTEIEDNENANFESFNIEDANRFEEFNYALGGILYYKSRFSCIRKLLRFTTSSPPKYELLPESFSELFKLFVRYNDKWNKNYPWNNSIYYFPGVEHEILENILRESVCNYLGILYLRFYAENIYSYIKPLTIPKSPNSQGEKKRWLDNLTYFKVIIERIMDNQELLKELGYLEYFEESKYLNDDKGDPISNINKFQSRLEEEFKILEQSQEIPPDNRRRFKNDSTNLIREVFIKYKEIFKSSTIDTNEINNENYNSISWKGSTTLSQKCAYCDDQGGDNSDYYSGFAKSIIKDIHALIGKSFSFNNTRSYLIKREYIFSAIDNLKINGEYVILNFGVNLSNFEEKKTGKKLVEGKYNGIEIVNLREASTNFTRYSIFVLKKTDLPNILFKDIPIDLIKRYKLKEPDEDFKISISMLDLFEEKNSDIRKVFEGSNIDKDLMKYVFLAIMFNLEIRWKKDIKMVQLTTYSRYEDIGLPVKVSDIISFDKLLQ